jgi:hypothetical protein
VLKTPKEQLAKQLILEAAAKWKNTPEAFYTEQEGLIVFTFTLRNDGSTSVINFDPESAAKQIIEQCESRLKGKNSTERVREIRLRGEASILISQMLRLAAWHFEDAIWQLPILTSTFNSCLLHRALGAERVVGKLTDDMLKKFNLKFPVSLLRGRRIETMGVQRERCSLWSRAGSIPRPRSWRAAR